MGNSPGLKNSISSFGKLPSPATWKAPLETLVSSEGTICLLDKQVGPTSVQDISGALNEYKRLYKAGIASPAEILTLSRAYPDNETYMQAASRIEESPVVVGGPASVEMIDREGHLITTNALTKAFDNYMSNFRTRNAMVLHSDVQVGWALPAYISAGGQIFKSGVNDQGLFFITEVRGDTRIAKRVIEQINEGNLKSYSIAGSATKVQNMQKGMTPYMQVDDLELAEVTVCEKGVNQGANFDVLKGMYLPKTDTCIDGSCLVQKEECDGSCLVKDFDHLDECGTQTGKLGQEQVQYREASEAEKDAGIMCGTCKYFYAGMSTCDLVNGTVMAEDWCAVFHPIDDSPVLENENNVREIMVLSDDGTIDFAKSFNNWVEKLSYTVDLGDTSKNGPSELDLKFPGWRRNPEEYKEEIERMEIQKADDHTRPKKQKGTPDLLKAFGIVKEDRYKRPQETDPMAGDHSMVTLNNVGGREAEHHQFLREQGWPSEVAPEAARYVPVIETETNDWGMPIHRKPPWTVNEAGQELGEKHTEDSPNVTKEFFEWIDKAWGDSNMNVRPPAQRSIPASASKQGMSGVPKPKGRLGGPRMPAGMKPLGT